MLMQTFLNNPKVFKVIRETKKVYNELETIIYKRKLKNVPGPSIYGMKVCEALGLPQDFLDIAKSIDIVENKPLKISPYNKKIVLDKCKICGDVVQPHFQGNTKLPKEEHLAKKHQDLEWN